MMFGFGGAGVLWPVIMLLFWVAVILLIVWAVARLFPTSDGGGRHRHGPPPPGMPPPPEGFPPAHSPRPNAGHGEARRILDERLARGEIDTDTYRRIRAELERPA